MIRLLQVLSFLLLGSTIAVAQPGPPPSIAAFSLPGSPAAGRNYITPLASVPGNAAMAVANRLWVMPFYMANPATVKTLSFDIGTGNASAWNARMCMFKDVGTGTAASAKLVVDSGTAAIGSGSVTGVQTVTLAGGGTALAAGYYWVGFMADSAAESLFAATNLNTFTISGLINGFDSPTAVYTNLPTPGWYMAQTFGACPSTFSASPTSAAQQVVPIVVVGF